MNPELKAWKVTYKHPFTNELITAIVYAESESDARKKAIENNVPTYKNSFYFQIVSIDEMPGITPIEIKDQRSENNFRTKSLYRGFHEEDFGYDRIYLNGRIVIGRWVEGYLDYDEPLDCAYISGSNPEPTRERRFRYKVLKESVSEAVRHIRDRKGRSIFENDVIKHYNNSSKPDTYTLGVVQWDDRNCEWNLLTSSEKTYKLSSDCYYEVISNMLSEPVRLADL